jgi:hypothetical protein
MTRETGILVVALLRLPAVLPAQREDVARYTLHEEAQPDVQRATWQRATVHYGKWLTGASAVALTWMAAHEHARSTDAWDALSALCRANHGTCSLGPDGRYLNALSEEYYQRSLRHDRRARTRLLAGQGALLLTIGFFLLDRRHGDDRPPNIPFAPLKVSVDERGGGARVGLRWTF